MNESYDEINVVERRYPIKYDKPTIIVKRKVDWGKIRQYFAIKNLWRWLMNLLTNLKGMAFLFCTNRKHDSPKKNEYWVISIIIWAQISVTCSLMILIGPSKDTNFESWKLLGAVSKKCRKYPYGYFFVTNRRFGFSFLQHLFFPAKPHILSVSCFR